AVEALADALREPYRAAMAKKGKTTRSSEPLLTKAEAKKTLAKATGTLRALVKQSERNAWQIGRKLTELDTLGVPEATGYASAADYANDELGIPRSTAFLYMRAAGAFSQSMVATFGVTKLNRALAYIAATPEEETPRDVPTLKIRVPDAEGTVHDKPFADT